MIDAAAQAAFSEGVGHHAAGRLEAAVAAYDKTLRLSPTFAQARFARATAWLAMGDGAKAARDFAAVAQALPDFPEAFYGLGQAQVMDGGKETALAAFERFLALRPGDLGGLRFRGEVLHRLQRYEEALRDFDALLLHSPNDWSALHHRANILTQLGKFQAGLDAYRRALAIAPDHAEIHCAFGMGLLRIGEFRAGFAEWDWRKQAEGRRGGAPFPQPEWLGREEIDGQTLFIHAEQGLGDSIQFARYLPRLAERGARVIFGAQDSLAALFNGFEPGVEVIGRSRPPAAFDYHCSLLTLPLALGDTAPQPMTKAYLKADAERAAHWRAKIGPHGFKIGLAWRSNPGTDDSRSAPLEALAALAEIPGVRLISLHRPVDGAAGDANHGFVEHQAADFDAGPGAMLDTAAVMENLDLIVSVDTALLHLAGAMARPTIGLIKQVPDWRWETAGETSPWYPTMTLLRQRDRNDWTPVIAELAARARRLAA